MPPAALPGARPIQPGFTWTELTMLRKTTLACSTDLATLSRGGTTTLSW